MKIDLDLARETYVKDMDQLIEEFGDASSIPADDQRGASEKLRAAYAIHANPDLPVPQIFKIYTIEPRVWQYFVDNVEDVKHERKLSRSEKQAKIMNWAAANVGEKVDLTKLMEIGDIAYTMAKKITEDRPDVFRKIKRGNFEVRDPKADREADKKKDEASAEEQK